MTDPREIRVRVDPKLRAQFDELIGRKSISAQKAFEGMLRLLLAMDDIGQSVMMGQIEPSEIVIKEMMRAWRERKD